ncbi:extracellular solute-binding protein [Cohnella fermenti]|uniref:Extracellular solute-binding protein n=1 Tax=Cohnella fermenti TaxID=2565925 RepID=A0A4S4BGP5_9BACL|nr:extracellular solute-binding protein [Cohnella fermenti]THF73624.1 extracellular solute-binding protein [Cohnella fermenti]
MKSQKKHLLVLASLALMGTTLAGCGGNKDESANSSSTGSTSTAGSSASTTASAPTDIKAMTILFGDPPATSNNKALEDIEKRANVKLNITFVPSEAYSDKLSVAVSAGDSYDLLLMDGGKNDKFLNLVKMGAFHDLTPYIENTTNLKLIDDLVWNNVKIEDKVYGIPRPRGLYGGGDASFIIRKDWLDDYGLELPTTLDELTNVLQVFKEKDPAGGGKTVPLTLYASEGGSAPGPFSGTAPIRFALGMPFDWEVQDGQAIRDVETPEEQTYLDWLRDAWSQGLIDKDSPVLKNQQQSRNKLLAGVAGVFAGNVSDLNEANIEQLRQTDPDAELAVIDLLEGPNGDKGVGVQNGYYGLWAIPSSVPEEKVQKIIDFLDFSASEENIAFSKAGVTGIHSSEFKDGVAVQTEEQKAQYDLDKPSAFVLENRSDPYVYASSKVPAILEVQKKSLDVISEFGIVNPFLTYNSETAAKNPDSFSKMSAVMTQYVLGEADWAAVQKEIDAWANGVGIKIKQELLDQYNVDHP